MLKVLALSLNNSNFVNRSNSKQNINTASNLFLGKDTVSFKQIAADQSHLTTDVSYFEELLDSKPTRAFSLAYGIVQEALSLGTVNHNDVIAWCERAETADSVLSSMALENSTVFNPTSERDSTNREFMMKEISKIKAESEEALRHEAQLRQEALEAISP